MKVLLIANIGNSDLILNQKELLPATLATGQLTVRQLGEEIRQNVDRYAEHLSLPLLTPTLRWLFEHEQLAPEDLCICLFASDQPAGLTREDERQKDTLPTAETIRKLVSNGKYLTQLLKIKNLKNGIPAKQICLETIDGNPADYANMLAIYTSKLPSHLKRIASDEQVYLEVSGGTPAMTAMLIVTAVEMFGARTHTLYVDRHGKEPYEVAVASELFGRRTRATLRTQIEMHAYSVALRTLNENRPIITSDENRFQWLGALLRFADRRLAFDFEAARDALVEARRRSTGRPQAQVQFWLQQLEDPELPMLLAELIHSARIKDGFGDYADFVQRLFRFQEACFRYMAEQVGMQYSKPGDERMVSSDWLEQQPGLKKFSAHYTPAGANTGPLEIDFGRTLTRYSLSAVVDYFIQQDLQWAHWQPVATKLHALSKAADLRNKGLSGHGFQGISRTMIEEAYGSGINMILQELETIYQALFSATLSDDPYAVVNQILLEGLE